MRVPTSLTLIAISVGAALFSGCAGGTQSSNAVMPNSAAVTAVRSLSESRVNPNDYKGLKDLYVADYTSQSVKILTNKHYREVGQITSGLVNPNGVFLDRHGNLYVASQGGGASINEYAPNATSPSFTYSTGMMAAIDVTVDAHGNVYEADGTGFVLQYFQGSNTPIAGCSPGGGSGTVSGVTVDSANDVFVSFTVNNVGAIAEYPGGLGDCSKQIVLGVPVVFPYGIAIDKNNNLVVADAGAAKIDVVDPPYTSVTRTIGSGFTEPVTVRLSRDNKLAFATDYKVHDVFVLNYQTGAIVTMLGSVYGLSDPSSAVDGPDALY
jgi:hypothetical protein